MKNGRTAQDQNPRTEMFSPVRLVIASVMACAAAASGSIAHAGDDDATLRRRLPGTWTAKGSCSGDRTVFADDGTFLNHAHNSARKSGLETVFGRFAVQAGHLVIVPLYEVDAETGRTRKTDEPALSLSVRPLSVRSLSVREDGDRLILQNDVVFGAGAKGARSAKVHRCPDKASKPAAPRGDLNAAGSE